MNKFTSRAKNLFLQFHKYFYQPKTVHCDQTIPELPFTLIMTGYNNEKYVFESVQRAISQQYKNFSIIYIDDASTDQTQQILSSFNNKNLFIQHNKERKGKLENLYTAIHQLADQQIILELDADDYLVDEFVLARFNYLFHTTGCLVAHAQYKNQPTQLVQQLKLKTFSQAIPFFIKNKRNFRSYPWIYSGLRCYYAYLFKKIDKQDLLHNDKFLQFFHDAAIFYPMLEMAGTAVEYIPAELLLRNIDSPINDFKQLPQDIEQIKNKVLTTKKYEKTNKIF